MQSRFSLPADVATVTNMLERLNQEIKGRSHVIRIPTRRPLCDSSGLGGRNSRGLDRCHRYLNMEMLREQRKQLLPLEAA